MPQLIPFFFLNQLSFSFLTLLILIYIFSKYILPSFIYQQVIRMYITKLGKKSLNFFNSPVVKVIVPQSYNKKFFIYFISLILLFVNFYLAIYFFNITVIGLVGFTFSFVFSFVTSTFVYDNYKFSNNFVIKFLQKFIIFNICIFLLIFILSFLDLNILDKIFCDGEDDNEIGNNNNKDLLKISSGINEETKSEHYEFKVNKNLAHKVLNSLGDAVSTTIKEIAPNLGVGAAAGAAAKTALKLSGGMPPVQRAVFLGATTATTAASTKIGTSAGSKILQHVDFNDLIKESSHADPNINRIPSPNSDLISSMLESGDLQIPLVGLLKDLSTLNVLELIIIILLIWTLIYKYIFKFIIKFILIIKDKYFLNKFNWINNVLKQGDKYNTTFNNLMFLYVLVCLLFMKFISIYICGELFNNIDDYVMEYNFFKNKKNSFLILISLSNIILPYKKKNKNDNFFYSNKFNIKKLL